MQVEIDRVFQATREQLYAIWTDANQISQWFGCPIVIDPKVGGQLRFDFPLAAKSRLTRCFRCSAKLKAEVMELKKGGIRCGTRFKCVNKTSWYT